MCGAYVTLPLHRLCSPVFLCAGALSDQSSPASAGRTARAMALWPVALRLPQASPLSLALRLQQASPLALALPAAAAQRTSHS